VSGTWQVHVTLDGEHIPGSIFTVTILEEISLGGEGKIRVFFSSTSSTEKGRSDFFDLERLMESKKIHLRPDFDPWIPVDVLDKEDRYTTLPKLPTLSVLVRHAMISIIIAMLSLPKQVHVNYLLCLSTINMRVIMMLW
jgi:hypothetical protein